MNSDEHALNFQANELIMHPEGLCMRRVCANLPGDDAALRAAWWIKRKKENNMLYWITYEDDEGHLKLGHAGPTNLADAAIFFIKEQAIEALQIFRRQNTSNFPSERWKVEAFC